MNRTALYQLFMNMGFTPHKLMSDLYISVEADGREISMDTKTHVIVITINGKSTSNYFEPTNKFELLTFLEMKGCQAAKKMLRQEKITNLFIPAKI